MKEGINTTPTTALELFASKLKDHANFDFSIASSIHTNSPNNNAPQHAINGESLWQNINEKMIREKKKFNSEVSDMLVLEVLKRKELLIENNTSRDLTFSENKRNAWNDVRRLLMDKFTYFDLNVEAIKSHWRYRKRKVTDVYQEQKCADDENRMQSKFSTIDLAIYRTLKDLNMLEKNTKAENSTASPSEGEDQILDNYAAFDRSSLSVSPASAFTQQHQSQFQPQQQQQHWAQQQQNGGFSNHQRLSSFHQLLQLSAAKQQQPQLQPQPQQQHIQLGNFGLAYPQQQVNATAFNKLAPFNNNLAFGTTTTNGSNIQQLVQQLAAFVQQQHQQKLVRQQLQQNSILNSPESSKSVEIDDLIKQATQHQEYEFDKTPSKEEATNIDVEEDECENNLPKPIRCVDNGAINRCSIVNSITSYDDNGINDGKSNIVLNGCNNTAPPLVDGILKFASGLENITTNFKQALSAQNSAASVISGNENEQQTNNVDFNSKRAQKRRAPNSDATLEEFNVKASRRLNEEVEENDLEREMDDLNLSVETHQKSAFNEQRKAFVVLRSAINEVMETVVPEAITALRNYNSTFQASTRSTTASGGITRQNSAASERVDGAADLKKQNQKRDRFTSRQTTSSANFINASSTVKQSAMVTNVIYAADNYANDCDDDDNGDNNNGVDDDDNNDDENEDHLIIEAEKNVNEEKMGINDSPKDQNNNHNSTHKVNIDNHVELCNNRY